MSIPRHRMVELKLADLTTRVLLTSKAQTTGPSSALILLHGHGSEGDDLVYLAEELQLPPHTALVFPEGPLIVDRQTSATMRGWWPVDARQLQVAMFTGQAQLASRLAFRGCDAARTQFVAFLDALDLEFGLCPPQIAFGGFSQGAVLCLDALMHDERPWAGLLHLSGALPDVASLRARLNRRPAVPVFISHGKFDPILPFASASQLHEEFLCAGWSASFAPFDGSHGIPPDVASAMSAAVYRWLEPAACPQGRGGLRGVHGWATADVSLLHSKSRQVDG